MEWEYTHGEPSISTTNLKTVTSAKEVTKDALAVPDAVADFGAASTRGGGSFPAQQTYPQAALCVAQAAASHT